MMESAEHHIDPGSFMWKRALVVDLIKKKVKQEFFKKPKLPVI